MKENIEELQEKESPDNVIKLEDASIEEVLEDEVQKEPTVDEVLEDENISVDDKIKFLTENSEKLVNRITQEPYYLDLRSLKQNQVPKYISDLLLFIKNKLKWNGTDFVYVEAIHKEIENLKKTYTGGSIPLPGSIISAFYQLQMHSGGEGYKDVKRKKYILEPFLAPYREINDDNETYKKWGQDYQNLLMEKDTLTKAKFEEEQLGKGDENEEAPLIDIPRTLDDIVRIMGDINGVIGDIKKQQDKQQEKDSTKDK